MIDEEEEPQPARRHRQVSHILDYEEDWEEAERAVDTNRQPQLQQEDELRSTRKWRLHEPESSSDDRTAPASGKRKQAVLLDDGDDDEPSTIKAAERQKSGRQPGQLLPDRAQSTQHAVKNQAARLAEEGLDPVELVDVPEPRRHGRQGNSSAGQGSIKDRMRQNQEKLQTV